MRSVLYFFSFYLIFFTVQAQAEESADFRVASLNIHYTVPSDPNDSWPDRKRAVAEIISLIQPDIMAFQEMETFSGGHFSEQNLQLDWVLAQTGYLKAGAVGDPRHYPGTQPILYNAGKFRLTEQGFFFYSDTPDEIYSRQWNGSYPYFSSWVRLLHLETNRSMLVVNVHTDYASRSNRLKTSKLIVQRLDKIKQAGDAVLVIGDFNAPAGFREMDILTQQNLAIIKPSGATNRILGMNILPAIDHILISEGLLAKSGVQVWRNRFDGEFPSDHYPVSADIFWRESH